MKLKYPWLKTINEIPNASNDSLRQSLITMDGRGKQLKEACLNELLKRNIKD